MEVEVFGVGSLGLARELVRGRDPLGREDERGIEGAGVLRGLLDLGEREVFDGGDANGLVGVAEVGVLKLGRSGPGGEYGRVGKVVADQADGALVQRDEVGVGEVILGREAVGRVDEQRGNEGRGR